MPRWNGEIMQRGKRTRVGAPEARATGPMLARKKGSWLAELFGVGGESEYIIAEDIPSESERTDKTAGDFFDASAREVEQSDFMLDALAGVQDLVTPGEFEVLQGEVWAGKLVDEFALQSRIKSLQESRKTYTFRDWANDRNRMTGEEIFELEAEEQGVVSPGAGPESFIGDAFGGVFEDVYATGSN